MKDLKATGISHLTWAKPHPASEKIYPHWLATYHPLASPFQLYLKFNEEITNITHHSLPEALGTHHSQNSWNASMSISLGHREGVTLALTLSAWALWSMYSQEHPHRPCTAGEPPSLCLRGGSSSFSIKHSLNHSGFLSACSLMPLLGEGASPCFLHPLWVPLLWHPSHLLLTMHWRQRRVQKARSTPYSSSNLC